MVKRMLIDALHPEETRVVIADEKQIYDFDFVSSSKKPLKGNVYLAKITRVEPSLQAAFVEYGGNKQGFLPFSEIHPDYYQIPVSDRKRLMEEADQEESEDTATLPENSEENTGVDNDTTPSADGGEAISDADSMHSLPLAPAIEEMPASELEQDDARPLYAAHPLPDATISDFIAPPDMTQNMPPSMDADGASISADGDGNMEEKQAEGQTDQPGEDVETIQNPEEEAIDDRRKKNRFARRYKIQEVIRRGQVVLIQVIKEERGNKGASLTTYLSLAGRYCVLMPNSPKDGGISRKIASADDRKRLKAISTELRLADGMSVIIRTAGMDRTHAEIKRDYDYLVKLWNRIREDTLKSNAPALIYEESDVLKRAIRDQYTNDIDEVIIEGNDGYEAARDFMKLLLPSHTPKIKHYTESVPLFYAYNIEEQLLSMHDETVKLRSGGYIVINPTEALISIDVNSGRSTGERNIEETATKTNLEAAVEVARQLRLRDLAGLIVIDFIDMLEARNRRAVEKALKDALKMDRAKIQLGRISPFGLLEMSRQRLRPSISETNMVQCPHCVGRGYVRSNESMSIQMIRALEKEAASGSWSGLRLLAPQAIALHLLNTKRAQLRSIEERHGITVQVLIDTELSNSDYNLEKMRRSSERASQQQGEGQRRGRGRDRDRGGRSQEFAPVSAETILEEMGNDIVEDTGASENRGSEESSPRESRPGEDRPRRSRGRRGRRGGRNREDRGPREENFTQPQLVSSNEAPESAASDAAPAEGSEERGPRGGRNRNRGGRRRPWRERDQNPSGEPTNDNRSESVERNDGKTLPAFAVNEPVLPPPPRPRIPHGARAAGNERAAGSALDTARSQRTAQKRLVAEDDRS